MTSDPMTRPNPLTRESLGTCTWILQLGNGSYVYELAKLWDEAKQAVGQRAERDRLRARHTCMKDMSSRACIGCNTGTPYPAMTLEDFAPSPDEDCCVGDRSRCRCAPAAGGWSDEDTEREKWLAVWSGDE